MYLIHEKVFLHTDKKGMVHRRSKTVEIAIGWDEISQNEGTPYVSFANGVISVTPDVDRKVKLFLYPYKKD